MVFDKTFSNLARLRKLIEVLIKYGFDDVVNNTRLRKILSPKKKASILIEEEKRFMQSRWERIRLVMEELGPTYIKLGQLLSNRPDILPEQLIKEFEKLQDEVPPFNVSVAKTIIETELGKPIRDIFIYFDEKSFGSASIGQVHRARLITGEDVVVKVRRPNARRQIISDLLLIREFVKFTENYFMRSGILNPLEIVEAFSKSLMQELDYTNEARNLEQFKSLYKNLDRLYIPKVYREFTTNKVIVIEFISGCKVNDKETFKSWGLEPRGIANDGLNIYLTQIFDYGIFHADPHPGNILIKPNGSIALIDFGNVGKLIQSQKFAFAGVFIALANKDAKSMATNLRRLSIDHEIDDMRAFEYDLNDLIQDYVLLEPDAMGVREFTGRLQKLAYKYKLKIPGTIFLILRALALLEGIARSLDPDFDVLENIKPFGQKLLTEQYSLKNITNEVTYSLTQAFTLFYNLPLEIRDIIKQVRRGRIAFNMRIQGFDHLQRQLDFATNRVVFALIIGALVIASAIAYSGSINTGVHKLLGIPYFSWLCWIVALFFGIILVINDFRSGRNRNQ